MDRAQIPVVEHWYGVTFGADGRRCITVSYPSQNRLVVCHHPSDTEEQRIEQAVQAAVKMVARLAAVG